MSVYLSQELRRLLEEADNGQCVYCQTTVGNTGQRNAMQMVEFITNKATKIYLPISVTSLTGFCYWHEVAVHKANLFLKHSDHREILQVAG